MSWRKLVFLATLIATAGQAAPAQAWGYGYSPFTGGANWQWIYRSLGYPLNRMSSVGAPFYLVNPLLYNATYSVAKGTGAGRRQQQFQQVQQYQQYQQFQQAQNSSDQEPFTYGVARQRQFLQSPYPVNQTAYAPWIQGGPAPEWLGPDPVNEDNGSALASAPHTVPAPSVAGGDGNSSPVPVAPEFARTGNADGASAPAANSASAGSPFAGAFITLVRTKFKGNIARALKDKQARSLARSLEVIPEGAFDADDIPLERLALIEKVLADDRESASTRLSAVRMLLKH